MSGFTACGFRQAFPEVELKVFMEAFQGLVDLLQLVPVEILQNGVAGNVHAAAMQQSAEMYEKFGLHLCGT